MSKVPYQRRIIVFMDGTSNQVGDQQTHVVRLFRGLDRSPTQLAHYIQGVGTRQSETLRGDGRGRLRRLVEFVTGLGLEDNVLNGYRYICKTYDWDKYDAYKKSRKTEDFRDQISLVGFSRGAYSARVLAGFISVFGLLHPTDLHLAAQEFRGYRLLRTDQSDAEYKAKLQTVKRYRQVFRPLKPPIQSLILFDTVSEHRNLREFWKKLVQLRNPFGLDSHARTTKNGSVRIVLHALSIDEKRRSFRPLLWEGKDYYGNDFETGQGKDQIVRQTWFAGYHSDVGGGTFEDQSALAKVPLKWMLDQMADVGENWDWVDQYWPVEIEGKPWDGRDHTADGRRKVGADYRGPMHDSMKWYYAIAEWLPKRCKHIADPNKRGDGTGWYAPCSEPRYIAPGSDIHDSVSRRKKDLAMKHAPKPKASTP